MHVKLYPEKRYNMQELSKETLIKRIKIWSVVIILLLFCISAKMIMNQNISSIEDFQKHIGKFGPLGPLVLIALQAFQVIIPILPGYLGCAAGAIAFGPAIGFLCNYIGISAGSIAAFYIGQKYGIDVIMTLFSKKQFLKWSNRVKKKRSYGLFLFVATLLPLFPDDFLCYFSGLLKMNARKFIWIIILGKPWCILAYSLAFGMIK